MSRSPKSNQLLNLSQWYISESLKKIHPLVKKIFYLQDYDFENKVKVTQSNQLITSHNDILMQVWKKIHPQVQKIFYLQDFDLENKV